MRKIYLAGKIAGEANFKDIFKIAEQHLMAEGHAVMNPAELPSGFDYEDYMKVGFAMIEACDTVAFLPNWHDSEGAKREQLFAKAHQKEIIKLPYNLFTDTSFFLEKRGLCKECLGEILERDRDEHYTDVFRCETCMHPNATHELINPTETSERR